nr:unnamed protein product [Spirometra erinaceieuropaei]
MDWISNDHGHNRRKSNLECARGCLQLWALCRRPGAVGARTHLRVKPRPGCQDASVGLPSVFALYLAIEAHFLWI